MVRLQIKINVPYPETTKTTGNGVGAPPDVHRKGRATLQVEDHSHTHTPLDDTQQRAQLVLCVDEFVKAPLERSPTLIS